MQWGITPRDFGELSHTERIFMINHWSKYTEEAGGQMDQPGSGVPGNVRGLL